MRKDQRRKAHRHALVGLMLIAAVTSAWIAASNDEADADDLKIPVGKLRSEAATLGWLAAHRSQLPERFTKAQADHLAKNIVAAGDELRVARVSDPNLKPLQEEAADAARPLISASGSLSQGRPPEGVGLELRRRLQQLAKIEGTLERSSQ
jgi:hypothetical protein